MEDIKLEYELLTLTNENNVRKSIGQDEGVRWILKVCRIISESCE